MPKHIDTKPEIVTKPKSKRRWLGGVRVWVWGAVVVLVIFEALITNNQATNGQQLADLEQKQSELSLQVSELDRQIAITGSLQNIRQRATDQLGLQPVDKNVLYVSWPTPEEDSP